MNAYLSSTLLSKHEKLRHGFFTRAHAIAKDDESRKQKDLREITQIFNSGFESLITLCQVHSACAVVVDEPFKGPPPKADALICLRPGLLLGVLTADCVPILLCAQNMEMVAAIHAGWRGALGGIIQTTVKQMQTLGGRDIMAAIGPCIWQQSYEVGDDFYARLGHNNKFFVKSPESGRWHFDLPGFVNDCLIESGVNQIEPSMADTYTNGEQFFSYRRKTHHPHEHLKSNLSVIGLLS